MLLFMGKRIYSKYYDNNSCFFIQYHNATYKVIFFHLYLFEYIEIAMHIWLLYFIWLWTENLCGMQFLVKAFRCWTRTREMCMNKLLQPQIQKAFFLYFSQYHNKNIWLWFLNHENELVDLKKTLKKLKKFSMLLNFFHKQKQMCEKCVKTNFIQNISASINQL